MTRTDDLRRLLTVALAADEPASANAIRRTLATWEQEDAARRAWDAALRTRIVPVVPPPVLLTHDNEAAHVAVLGASPLACLGLAQSCDDLVEHVPDVRPPSDD